jgi:hypothetical protein
MPRGRKPHVEVIERGVQTSALTDPRYNKRLQNPFGSPSAAVQLVDSTREARWFNGAVGTDHIWRAKQNGWDQVRLNQVADPDQLGGYTVTNGFVTRGERGQEVLMSMPRDIRNLIQNAKTKANIANMGNPNRTKNDIVEAAASQIGPEAAEMMDANLAVGHAGPIGQVKDSYERIERRPEE